MSLAEHRLIDLDRLSEYTDLLRKTYGIWVGDTKTYEAQKSTIKEAFIAIVDDGIPLSFVTSSIPDDEELDDIVFNDTKPNPSPSTPGNEATDEDLDNMLGGN